MNRRASDIEGSRFQLVGSRAVFAYALIATGFALAILSIGEGGPLISRVLAVVMIVLNSAWIPIVYLAGASGLGRLARRWVPESPARWVIELGIGFTLTLWLTHLLGVFGWLNPISAWIITGTGCLVMLWDLGRRSDDLNTSIGRTRLTLPGVVFILGSVLVVLMSSNPPGSLWDTEFGSYDALSYHLELPREWLERGRIVPVEHNVYSFLPGYIEAAYLHFAYLTNADNFLTNEARVTFAASMFSAMLVILSALGIRSVVDRAMCTWSIGLASKGASDRLPGIYARALIACTPWIVIVGSLTYNEMGVVLLGISALGIAIERPETNRPSTSQSVIAAFIVAGACSIKPTALFLLAPSIATILLAPLPLRRWIKPVLIAMIVGTITLAPWLIRNELAAGNPVFPQLSSVFGDGHWTQAQHTLYAGAHTFDGTLFDRFAMLIMPDPNSTQPVLGFRGFTNIQWALTPLLGFLGVLVLLLKERSRGIGLMITIALLLPIIAWMSLTHLQSRFLVPMTPLLIMGFGLGMASINNGRGREMVGGLISLAALAWTVFIAGNQLHGNPFASLVLSTAQFTGELDMRYPSWTSSINTILEPDETVYLLGDATPFYVRSPVIYNTVYDHWLIEEAIESNPNNPQRWSQTLGEQGVDVVVIALSELRRFDRSGWLPESIRLDQISEWIRSLGEPIYEEFIPGIDSPVRAAYRIPKPNTSPSIP